MLIPLLRLAHVTGTEKSGRVCESDVCYGPMAETCRRIYLKIVPTIGTV